MRFHDYKSIRPAGERGSSTEQLRQMLIEPTTTDARRGAAIHASMELAWRLGGRPFYNVYPVAIELCRKTQLRMKWGDAPFPLRSIVFRFPAGHEPHGVAAALVRAPSLARESLHEYVHQTTLEIVRHASSVPLISAIQFTDGKCLYHVFDHDGISDVEVGDAIPDVAADAARLSPKGFLPDSINAGELMVRLVVFAALLANGTDLITPVILAADREEYDATTDEDRKLQLEQRAANRVGIGFDIGRQMEIERSVSPHWRCPHYALFHTGPGGAKPELRLRSGCVVNKRELSSVPTGFMGPDAEATQAAGTSPVAVR